MKTEAEIRKRLEEAQCEYNKIPHELGKNPIFDAIIIETLILEWVMDERNKLDNSPIENENTEKKEDGEDFEITLADFSNWSGKLYSQSDHNARRIDELEIKITQLEERLNEKESGSTS